MAYFNKGNAKKSGHKDSGTDLESGMPAARKVGRERNVV